MNVMRRAVASSTPFRMSHGTRSSPATFAAASLRCPAISVAPPSPSAIATRGWITPSDAMDAARSATLSGVIFARGFHGAGFSWPTAISRLSRSNAATFDGLTDSAPTFSAAALSCCFFFMCLSSFLVLCRAAFGCLAALGCGDGAVISAWCIVLSAWCLVHSA